MRKFSFHASIYSFLLLILPGYSSAQDLNAFPAPGGTQMISLSSASVQTCNPKIPLDKPNSRYIIDYLNHDDEVIDSETGLIWKRCVKGMYVSGTFPFRDYCSGSPINYTWEEAVKIGYYEIGPGSWRLPNLKELKSLVETACYGQAINQWAFPNAPGYTWSASPIPFVADYHDKAWLVDFESGLDFWQPKKGLYAVRLVRDP